MRIQILGTGCPKCNTLMTNAEQAVKDCGIEAEIEKVTDLAEIARMGVMMTPGLAIDGKVKSAGRLLSAAEIAKLLRP